MTITFLIIISFLIYILIEYVIRALSYSYLNIGKQSIKIKRLECWKDIVFFLSPGFWLARYFKQKIKDKNINSTKDILKKYIINNNHFNITASLILLILSIALNSKKDIANKDIECLTNNISILSIFFWIMFWRLVSRCSEITMAFGIDAISGEKPSSNLGKYERIKLAIKSYLEIYIISSSVYLFMPQANNIIDAIFISLGSGTLSSAGSYIKIAYESTYGFSEKSIYLLDTFIFIQIFSTLTLIILSLAVYIGKKEEE